VKRSGSKTLAGKRSTPAKLRAKQKLEPSRKDRPSAKQHERIARGKRTLQELFAIGNETFKRLDTETIIRGAEDKDLEYM